MRTNLDVRNGINGRLRWQNLTAALLNRFRFPKKECVIRRETVKGSKRKIIEQMLAVPILSTPCEGAHELWNSGSIDRISLYKTAALSSLHMLPLQFTSPSFDSVFIKRPSDHYFGYDCLSELG